MYEIKVEEMQMNLLQLKDKYQKENIVMLGDSITDWYPIDEMFKKEKPIINSGKAGTKSQEILERLPQLVYQYNPTKVFILIGTNDLNVLDEEKDINKTINNIKKMVEEINENRKYAKIYLQSIYPISKKVGKESGYRTNEEIKVINLSLKNYCQKEKLCEYIDMYNILINEDGNLKDKYTIDGLHITKEGYKIITKELEKYM